MPYKIVKANYLSDLEEAVNKEMEAGWVPTGGHIFRQGVKYKDEDTYQQAMILDQQVVLCKGQRLTFLSDE